MRNGKNWSIKYFSRDGQTTDMHTQHTYKCRMNDNVHNNQGKIDYILLLYRLKIEKIELKKCKKKNRREKFKKMKSWKLKIMEKCENSKKSWEKKCETEKWYKMR